MAAASESYEDPKNSFLIFFPYYLFLISSENSDHILSRRFLMLCGVKNIPIECLGRRREKKNVLCYYIMAMRKIRKKSGIAKNVSVNANRSNNKEKKRKWALVDFKRISLLDLV